MPCSVVGFQLFSPSFFQENGGGACDRLCVPVDSLVAGSKMDGNGQDRGGKTVEEPVATVENKSLEPRKREAVGGYLVSGEERRVPPTCLVLVFAGTVVPAAKRERTKWKFRPVWL